VVTLTLTPEGEAETVLKVQHENLESEETFGHARFFWRTALQDLKEIAETES
jgi:hypothetical protein